MRIDRVTVHCTDTSLSMRVTPGHLYQWHVVENGWNPPHGYHYFIDQSGKLWEGRDLDTLGAHVGGQNTGNLGICVEGGKPGEPIRETTLTCLRGLLDYLMRYFDDPELNNHRDLDPGRTCPGPEFDAPRWYYDRP